MSQQVDSAHRIVILPPKRFSLPRFKRIWESREVLFRFSARDITLRYRQTALGVIWVVLQPLLGAGVLSFVFGDVAKLSTDGIPPLVFTFAGMLVWNSFSGVVSRGSSSLVQNASMVSKVYFPRLLVPLSTVGSASLDFVVSLAFMAILMVIYGIVPGIAILLVPIWFLLFMALAAGIAMFTSALMVGYRDVQYIVPFVLQILLYASPIAYSAGNIPHKDLIFYQLNPLTSLLEDMQWSLLNLHAPSAASIITSIAVPLIVLLAGATFFEQLERSFADVI